MQNKTTGNEIRVRNILGATKVAAWLDTDISMPVVFMRMIKWIESNRCYEKIFIQNP